MSFFEDIFSPFSGITGTLIDVLIWIIAILMVMVPLGIVVWLTTFKINVTIRMQSGRGSVIVTDKAKIIKDKKGVEKLKLLKTPKLFKGDKLDVPPDKAVNITRRGREWVDVYRTTQGQYIWCIDPGILGGVQIPDEKKKYEFEAMNTMDRDFYANEWEEAEKYRKKSMMEILGNLAPWVIIFLMFTIFLINWDAIAQPALESQKISVQMQNSNKAYLEELKQTAAIIQGIQIPEDENYNKTTTG